MNDKLRVLIVDDVDLVAEAFEALLATEPEFDVVGRVGSGGAVAEAVRSLQPDVAVIDVDMPEVDGFEAAGHIRDEPCEVLLLTALEGPGHIHKALAVGAKGYILKSTSGARLVDAIRTVAAGGTAIDPGLAAEALRSGPRPLTDREVSILQLVGAGMSNKDIASRLFLSGGTVRNYLSNAMVKLNVKSRVEAFAKAKQRGWL